MKTSKLCLALFLVPLLISLNGCLKTRAQLREDEDRVPNKTEPLAPAGGYAVEEIKQEITRLTGRIEEIERNSKSDAKAKTEETLKALEGRVHELESAQLAAIEAIKKLQSQVPPPDDIPTFHKAKEELKAKKYDESIQDFTAYMKNPSGKFFEESTFHRGEAYYFSKNYKKAIVDFSKFPEKYTKSPLLPKALLKIAQSFEAMGSKDDARAFYDQLIEEHPKSAEAKEARKKTGPKKKLK